MKDTVHIGIDWQPCDFSGWGNLAIHLSLGLENVDGIDTLLLPPSDTAIFSPMTAALMESTIRRSDEFATQIEMPENGAALIDIPLLLSIGNGGVTSNAHYFSPGRTYGLAYSETTKFHPVARDISQQVRILTGSNWGLETFKNNGIENVGLWNQGIDDTLFMPMPPSGVWRDRFVVFIGGQLSFRKGQDIALAAFKIFHERHDDAFLLAACESCWPDWVTELDLGGHMKGNPTQLDGKVDIQGWFTDNGLLPDSFKVLELMPHVSTPLIYREADVALFTNRCEASTNMVAMECLGMGIPTIISRNTGHLDLLDDGPIILHDQDTVPASSHYEGTEGWGESSVEEAVEALERVYSDYSVRSVAEQNSLSFRHKWSWGKSVSTLLNIMEGDGVI